MVAQNDTTLNFVCCSTIDTMIETLLNEMTALKADKVLVVGGFEKLRSFSASQFAGYEYLYNSRSSFGWLLKVCEYARETRHPQIIVSRFPRHWDPPKVTVIQAHFDPKIFVAADGSIGGTVHEIESSACSQFMNNPSKVTLNVIEESDSRTTLSVFFLGLRASSYYRQVLASQGCPPRKPLVCRVISGPEDPVLDSAEIARLRTSPDPQTQSAILMDVSDALETFCTSSPQRREEGAFSGGVLIPMFPQNEELPPGARSNKTAK